MQEYDYNRQQAVNYALQWALKRNPHYLNFDELGGDCTNYVSQCLYAGSGVMNLKPTFGWYYHTSSDRTASWTGVEYLADFLLNNKGVGPFARLVKLEETTIGDIVQLGDLDGHFYHSPFICAVNGKEIFTAAHTYDRWMYPLDNYYYQKLRCLHIIGVRK